MNKTISAVVAAGIMSSVAFAQDAGTKKPTTGDTSKRSDNGAQKGHRSEKEASKPGTPSGTKTSNPGIKPARWGEKK